jgi:hypothetical protein
MMEAVRTSETSVYYKETTRRNIQERIHLHTFISFLFKIMDIIFSMSWQYLLIFIFISLCPIFIIDHLAVDAAHQNKELD